MYSPDSRSDRRRERDALGTVELPAEALHGVHTVRALENFPLARRPTHPALIRAFGTVKLACAQTNRELGAWREDAEAADAIVRACRELSEGRLDSAVPVDALQGGAGTSTNMAVNEVLANRALQLLGARPGEYHRVDPLRDVNRHQSTNDTYPTALRLAVLEGLDALEGAVVGLQEEFQRKEQAFADVVKPARTQLQEAVLTTLGRGMGAYAEALARDRWRLYKAKERLRVVNLGGTAVGTGLGAPRAYIFRVVDRLRELSGQHVARAENLIDATQNADVFVEVSGMVKAHATSLFKISSDLRLLGSGPAAGIGELRLPPRQAGSSLMPGKLNPVIPEACCQAAMRFWGQDAAITAACSQGQLELNPFLPLVADALLDGVEVLARADRLLATLCVAGLEPDRERCRAHLRGAAATATALLPRLGHARVEELAERSRRTGRPVEELAAEAGWLTPEELEQWLSPEAVCRLGAPDPGDPASAGEGEPA
jgi:aspartate ammonia-lyase